MNNIFDWILQIRLINLLQEKKHISVLRKFYDNDSLGEKGTLVDSLIICCNHNWEVAPPILERSYAVKMWFYERINFTLNPKRATIKKRVISRN